MSHTDSGQATRTMTAMALMTDSLARADERLNCVECVLDGETQAICPKGDGQAQCRFSSLISDAMRARNTIVLPA